MDIHPRTRPRPRFVVFYLFINDNLFDIMTVIFYWFFLIMSDLMVHIIQSDLLHGDQPWTTL